MTSNVMQRFLAPERNVGGGDLATRVLAILALLILTGVVLPQTHVPYPLLKLSLLIASEAGLVGLMLGMFLRSKTYFAGFQLFLASLSMLWLAGRQLSYVAAVIGLIFIAGGVSEVVTRRSRLNGLLGLSSFHAPNAEATLLEEALLPEASDPEPTPGAALKPLTDGGAR